MDRYAQFDEALADGPDAAIAALIADRRADGDFQAVFYARLMTARLRFGAPPFPDGAANEIPAEHHEAYEQVIREAGREAGEAHLARDEFPQGWAFFRMLGESEPVRSALERYDPAADAEVGPAVEVAWHHAVHPQKGFDLVLDRHGICAAITLVQSSDLSTRPEVRQHCIRRLVRALHAQLSERYSPADYPGDFPEDMTHVDPSHLHSVAQLALYLSPGEEVMLARELCRYGMRLSPGLRGRDDPPFDETYTDYGRFLDVIGGVDVDAGLNHFRSKCQMGAAEGYRYPAEVLVSLLERSGRVKEALAVAREHLEEADERSLSCSGPVILAKKLGDFQTAAAVAKRRDDAVGYVASVIRAAQK